MTVFHKLFFPKAFPGGLCCPRPVLALILALTLAQGLGGCVSRPAPPGAEEAFVLTGKVGVREGAERFSANLHWRQQQDGFQMNLWGPLGQGRVEIVNKGSQIQLRNSRGVITEGDPERVMREQLGWTLPLAVLPAWVQGEPVADAPSSAERRDAEGRLAGFEQLGWTVALERYESVPAGGGERQLPTRITATRADTRVRVVVNGWQL